MSTGDLALRLPHGAARRLAVALVGLGLLLAAGPVTAAPRASETEEAAALDLLEQAARAAGTLRYSGTKYVVSWRPAGATASLVDVRHDPRRGMVLTSPATAARTGDDDVLVLAATTLDRALLDVLGDSYVLRLAGDGRCTGRSADVVEARRTAQRGGTVAGRFWVDRETGLLLRREVYDEQGRRIRSSAFVDLSLASTAGPVAPASSQRLLTRDAGTRVAPARLEQMRDDGWPVPAELPGGFVLFESRSREHVGDERSGEVLHLAYTDGLSTTSLFVQRGEQGGEPPDGFVRGDVAGRAVWVHDGAPERVVWGGGGRVWTLVSDAPATSVAAAVGALPHDPPPDTGVRARFSRGLSRVGGWLNPFG